MKLSREEQIDTFIDLYMVERGDHPTRLRNPIYGEERELCKKVALAMIELIKDEKSKEKTKWRSKRTKPKQDNDCLSFCSVSVLLYSPSLKIHSVGWFDFEVNKWMHIGDEEMKDFVWTYFPDTGA